MFHFKCFFLVCLVIVVFGETIPSQDLIQKGGRILGGTSVAYESQFPYTVSLRNSNREHFCSGSILTYRRILTAAQCTTGRNEDRIIVVAGSINLSRGGTTYNVIEIINHPDYSPLTMQNDIAIIVTSELISFSKYVLPIPLSSLFVNGAVSTKVVATGWGRLSNGTNPDNLQYINLFTVHNSFCQERHLGFDKQRITESTMCTRSLIGLGMCDGDVGSPLTLDGDLIGIVSWFIPCGQNFPDVFTRISYHLDWIIKNTNEVIVN